LRNEKNEEMRVAGLRAGRELRVVSIADCGMKIGN